MPFEVAITVPTRPGNRSHRLDDAQHAKPGFVVLGEGKSRPVQKRVTEIGSLAPWPRPQAEEIHQPDIRQGMLEVDEPEGIGSTDVDDPVARLVVTMAVHTSDVQEEPPGSTFFPSPREIIVIDATMLP